MHSITCDHPPEVNLHITGVGYVGTLILHEHKLQLITLSVFITILAYLILDTFLSRNETKFFGLKQYYKFSLKNHYHRN